MTVLPSSLIIRCFNEERHLPRLFEGIRQQTVTPRQLIVVDSGSTDGTVAVAQAAGAQVIHITQREFSFGRSLNRGAAAASGDVLVIVSAHTYPLSTQWLERLVEPFTQPQVALVYGGQRGDHRTKFSEQQALQQWFPDESCCEQRHPFCNNANAAIRAALWREVPYDEQLPGLEDIHWAQQMLSRGHKIVYRHDAAVAHIHEESYAKIYQRYRREAMALRCISPWEHMRLRDALILMRAAIRSDCGEARRQGRFLRTWGGIMRFRMAQYWGTYQGWRWDGTLTSALRARLYYPRGHRSPSVPPPLLQSSAAAQAALPAIVEPAHAD